jgi:hypothetical protein
MALCIKELLHAIIRPDKDWKTFLLYQWDTIVGSLHDKVRIEKIYDDTIILGVFHSCWIQELYILSPLLLKTINEKLDQPYIKQIRFKQISKKKIVTHKQRNAAVQKKEVQLTKKDELSLAKVTDPALRDALKAFRMRCYQE